jgi:hypothetical protein
MMLHSYPARDEKRRWVNQNTITCSTIVWCDLCLLAGATEALRPPDSFGLLGMVGLRFTVGCKGWMKEVERRRERM